MLAWQPLTILPLTYQSKDIELSDWVNLLTLCLAPLIAHIVAGTPSPAYLCHERPKWHDRICHYNPTSILWRYAAITDRRIRAKSWDRNDLAATNAIFWTTRGWDGSEEMVITTYCSHLPDHSRISLMSREMIKTLIVTFQGVQAITLLSRSFGSQNRAAFTMWMAVDTIFFPLALIGLLRLFAAFWLNEDFDYSTAYSFASEGQSTSPDRNSLLEDHSSPRPTRFRHTSFWPSRLFRVLFFLAVLGLLVLDVLYFISGGRYTVTTFTVTLVYCIFLCITAVIFFCYFWNGRTTTTIIPCITSTLYKIYTATIFGLTATAIIISSIETRKTPCSKYTSGQGTDADVRACWSPSTDFMSLHLSFNESHQGLVVNDFKMANATTFYQPTLTQQKEFSNFTGKCFGRNQEIE